MNEFASSRQEFRNTPEFYGQSREERLESAFKKFHLINEHIKDTGMKVYFDKMNDMTHAAQGQFPTELHYWMFMPTI